MEWFMVSRNDQCVKIAVQMIGPICIRAIKDHAKRIVFFLNIFDDLLHYHHLSKKDVKIV